MDPLSLKDWWNHYVADPNVGMMLNIALSAASVFLFVFSVWEVVSPPRVHDVPSVERRWRVLRAMLALSVAVVAVIFGLAGWLEGDRVGTSVRGVFKNGAVFLLVLTLLLRAIMRRGDALRREASDLA